MLLTLSTRGQSGSGVMRQAAEMHTGIPGLTVNTMPQWYRNVYEQTTDQRWFNRNPSEAEAASYTYIAAGSEVNAKLYSETLRARQKILQATSQKQIAENNFLAQAATISGNVAKSQHGLARNVAGVAHDMLLENSTTSGQFKAYQSGMRAARGNF